MSALPNICIVHPNRNAFSETFVRQHIESLNGNIFPVYGPGMPEFTQGDERLIDLWYKKKPLLSFTRKLCRLLPVFLLNRLPDSLKGFPYSEKLLQKGFEFYLADKKIDIVFAEFFVKGAYITEACKNQQVPLVVHTHGEGDVMNRFAQENYQYLFPGLFDYASAVIAVDDSSGAALLKLGLPNRKLHKIGSGINVSLFKQTKPSENKSIFFAAGRFTEKKAPHLTILAFADVVKKYPDAILNYAGAGELLDACKQLVTALHLEKSVIFCGVISPAEIAAHMQQSRAFLQHSVHTASGDAEGLPVVILEAMACGLPVISTKHNGIAEVIEDGVSGLLTEEFDTYAMSSAMISVLADPALADRLGAAACEKVTKEYTVEKINEKLNALIADCIQNHTSA